MELPGVGGKRDVRNVLVWSRCDGGGTTLEFRWVGGSVSTKDLEKSKDRIWS